MMINIKRLAFLAVILVAMHTVANAQLREEQNNYSTYEGPGRGQLKVNLMYNYGLPLGSLKNDFIDKGSARGFSGDILYWFKPEWAAGASFGFQDFYKKYPREMYKLSDGSDVSAVLTNSLQTIPVMAKVMYSPGASKGLAVQPYVSAASGVSFVDYNQYLGEFSGLSGTSAHFTAQVGAGVKIPFGRYKNAGFLLGANYNFTAYNKYDLKNISSLGLQAGFQFKLK